MSDQLEAVTETLPPLQDEDWELLVSRIRQRKVIPVIGRDLVRVPLDGNLVTYEQYVARQLAQKPEYNITDEDLKPFNVTLQQATLNEVMSVCVKKVPGNWPIDLHLQAWSIVKNAQLPVPPPLAQLARITDFDLFVTASFDPMLESALKGLGSPVDVVAYQGSRDDDIQDLREARAGGRRSLYYLLGKATIDNYDFAICDVEILRFLIKLQDRSYRPERLFDELREKHLLLLGVNFSDWLARFFLWLAKARVNEPDRRLREYLADQRALRETHLVAFLKHFSDTTRVVRDEPEKFVSDLYERWSAGGDPGPAPPRQRPTPPAEMPSNAVFLSYSRPDATAVQNLYAQLAAAGIPAWYDAALSPGDLWEETLAANIEKCVIFIPLISQGALNRPKAQFRAEWEEAVKQDKKWFGFNQTGIVPIIIDEDDSILKSPKPLKGLPDKFSQAQMYHFPGGKASNDFLEQLRRLLKQMAGDGG